MDQSDKTNVESSAVVAQPVAKEKWYSFLVPSIIGLVMAKLLGLVGALVAMGIYFGLKSKIGAVGAGILAVVLGGASGLILMAMIKA